MPRLTPYAAHEIAMVSSTPAGSGFPIGLMPGALPSDHASRQTLKTTAVRLPLGHSQFAGFAMPRHPPGFPGHVISVVVGWAKAHRRTMRAWAASHAPLPTLSDHAALTAWAKSREASAPRRKLCQATLPTLRVHVRNASTA